LVRNRIDEAKAIYDTAIAKAESLGSAALAAELRTEKSSL
jgi:hypothetical protein